MLLPGALLDTGQTSFKHNTAKSAGGAIMASAGRGEHPISYYDFYNGYGGRRKLNFLHKVVVAKVNFENNSAATEGGAIALFKSEMEARDTNFTGNIARADKGGAIFAFTESMMSLHSSKFEDNIAGSGHDCEGCTK